MKFLISWLTCVRKSIKRIELVDRCLILLMAILMLQSAYNLFANEISSGDTHVIDSAVRTTSAAIFGYFLSANFIKKSKKDNDESSPDSHPIILSSPEASSSSIIPTNKKQIGFSPVSAETDTSKMDLLEILLPGNQDKQENQTDQQVIIATILGLVALCVLLFARNFVELTPSSSGTLSQMRDFVSGCVGFLLGTPGKERT